ncbi:MAG: hypothetical protein V3V92_04585 [Candidatus Hydrothermarchaeales archaeon]
MQINFLRGCLLLLIAFASIPLVYSEDGVQLHITVNPVEPTNFQPTYEGENRAVITVRAEDYAPEFGDGHALRLRVTHLKGRGLINTGFPHMEGKVVFTSVLPIRDKKATMEYVFPIRGDYLLEAELLKLPSMMQIGTGELMVHVTEPFFEIRNSIILIALIFVFGLYLGRVYGGAAQGMTE